MATEFKLPELGENIESADVIAVLVKAGDRLEKEQSVIEIETDKATIEVPSTVEGVITEVLVKKGDNIKVGKTLVKVDDTGEKKEAVKEKPAPEEKPVVKDEAEKQKEVEADKHEETELPKEEDSKPKLAEHDTQPPVMKGSAPAAPSARRIAREIGVDINEVKGTGPGGRISMNDVKAHSKKLHQERKKGGGFGIAQEPLPDFTKYGEIEKVEMTKIRKVTAEHLSYAWAVIPHVTQFDNADITQLEKARKEYNANLKDGYSKLTVTAILLKIISAALKNFPQFNSSIDMETKEIIYKKYFNIGIAVDTEHGLMVPVVKDVDKKNINQLSAEMGELAQKARDKKISLEELQGGCFTITNLGGIGGTAFTPVVNSPEVAILGVSRGSYEPVYNGYGVFEPRLMLPLSLSYDHRIIDGADAVRFLNWVVEALENPLKLLIDG